MSKPQEEDLQRLSRAITQLGFWSWWTDEDAPTSLQFEFGGVQLYLPPLEDEETPSDQIALRLLHPSMVTFYHRSVKADAWIDALKDDQLDPLIIHEQQFVLSTNLRFPETLDSYLAVREQFIGPEIPHVQLVFMAGDIAVRVLAQNVRAYAHQGEVPLNRIAELNDKWWAYWREYWKAKDSDQPFPEDDTCERLSPGAAANTPFTH